MPYECVTCDKKFRYKISLRTHKCTGFVSNEHTTATPTTTTAAATTTKTTVNDDAVTFMDNDQQNMSTCQQSIDELITESCNRMGIVDRTETNPTESSSFVNPNNIETRANDSNQSSSMLQFDCDSFNLNDFNFCTGESSSTDLANVMPSMSEIFPQSIELLNALYDNAGANNNDLQHFYDSSPSTQPQQ